MKVLVVLVLLTGTFALGGDQGEGVTAPLGQSVELTADPELSDTGYFRLSWTGDGAAVTVEEATTADFSDARVIYEGTEAATVMSGRLDGTYHYRIRAAQSRWSAPIIVTVRHHSLAQAFAFLTVGALVFVATAVLIIAGHRRHRQEMAARGDGGSR